MVLKTKEKNKPKCKEWERRRREKLNDAFKNLSGLLPNFDPAKNLAKIDILERSAEFVKDLRLSNSRLVSRQAESDDEKCKLITQLQDEVNKLILRVKQLTILLKKANIKIPSGPFIKSLGCKKLKWSGQIKEAAQKCKEIPENEVQLVEENNDEHLSSFVPCEKATATSQQNGSSPSSTEESPSSSKENEQTSTSSLSKVSEIPKKKRKTKAPLTKKPKSVKLPVPNKCQQAASISTSTSGPTISLSSNIATSTTPTNTVTIPLQTTTPISAILTEPPKSTTATMLPMQTFILTSCPQNVFNQPTALTQISLSGFENGMAKLLQKIPIQAIRKPIPKIKHKRQRRKKAVIEEIVEKSTPEKETVQPECIEIDNDTPSQDNVGLINDEHKDKSSTDTGKPNLKDDNSELPEKKAPEVNSETENNKCLPNSPKNTDVNSELMQIQLYAHDPSQEAMEIETSSSSTLVVTEPINNRISLEKENANLPSEEKDAAIPKPVEIETAVEKSKEIITSEIIVPEANSIEVSTIDNNNLEQQQRVEGIVDHQDTNSSSSDPVSGEKISECIARSMDLIDAPDEELMELGDNWGDNANSPKSPISPTQMFLNMFPLLPKDSIVPSSEGNPLIPSTLASIPRTFSTSFNSQSHRSFFINSMLPEDNPQRPTSRSSTNFTVMQPSRSPRGIQAITNTSTVHSVITLTHTESNSSKKDKEANLENASQKSSSTTNNINTTNNPKITGGSLAVLPTATSVPSTLSSSSQSQTSVNKPSKKNLLSTPTKSTLQSEKSQPNNQLESQQQHLLKDNLFSDSIDFSTFHTLPFNPFSDQDFLRDNSRSRGLFDTGFSFNIDVPPIPPPPAPVSNMDQFQPQQQSLEIGDNYHTFQFQQPSRQTTQTATNETASNTSKATAQLQKSQNSTLPNSNILTSSSQNVSSSLHANPPTIYSNRSITNPPCNPPVATATAKTSLPKRSPAKASQAKQLFRPQFNDATYNVSTPSTYFNLQNISTEPVQRIDYRGQSTDKNSRPPQISPSKHSQIHQPPQTNIFSTPVFTPNPKQLEKQAPTKKLPAARSKEQTTASTKQKNPKETPPNKKSKRGTAITTDYQQQFASFTTGGGVAGSTNNSYQQQPQTRTSHSSSITIDPFNVPTTTASTIFVNPNQQNYENNLNIFSDFSLPLEPTNQHHYDHYNIDFSSFPPPLPPPSQIQQIGSTENQQQTTNARPSKTVPYYLQNVNENFSHHQPHTLHNPTQQISPNIGHNQNNKNPAASGQQYSRDMSGGHGHYHSTSTSNQYFHSSQPQAQDHTNYPNMNRQDNCRQLSQNPANQNTQQQQQRIPQTSNNDQSHSKPKQSTTGSAQQPHPHPQQQHPTYQGNSSARTVSTALSSSHRPVNWMTDNKGNNVPSQTQPSPHSRSSNVFARDNAKSNNISPTTTTNPFSVSKLVGKNPNPVVPNASSSQNQAHSQTPHRNPVSQRNINSSSASSITNYCAESLIRKNPAGDLSSSTNPTSSHNIWPLAHPTTKHHEYSFLQPSGQSHNQNLNNFHQQQYPSQQGQPSSTQMNSNNSSSFNDGSSNFSGYNFQPQGQPRHRNSFDQQGVSAFQQGHIGSSRHDHSHFNLPTHYGHYHQPPYPHHQQGTSSVSNFNLSSIFPEINDKTQQQQHHPSTSSTSVSNRSNNIGNVSSVNNSRSGYYAQQTSRQNK